MFVVIGAPIVALVAVTARVDVTLMLALAPVIFLAVGTRVTLAGIPVLVALAVFLPWALKNHVMVGAVFYPKPHRDGFSRGSPRCMAERSSLREWTSR